MALTLTPSSTMVPKSFRKLRGHDAFIIDDGAILRARLRSEMVCFPNLSKKFLNLVSGLHLSLAPFFLHTFLTASSASMAIPAFVPASCSFVDVTPFVYALFGLPPSGMQVHNLSPVTRRPFDSRYYRHLYLAPLLKTMSTIISWSSFWSFSMVHSARNVWYRVLHQKIPCRAFLHRIDLSSVPDGACLLCGQPETSEHLIILCPRKTPFWSSIWSHYFQNSFDTYRLTQALLYFSFPQLKPGLNLDPEIIFSSSLLALWRAHWRLIYDAVPFNVDYSKIPLF